MLPLMIAPLPGIVTRSSGVPMPQMNFKPPSGAHDRAGSAALAPRGARPSGPPRAIAASAVPIKNFFMAVSLAPCWRRSGIARRDAGTIPLAASRASRLVESIAARLVAGPHRRPDHAWIAGRPDHQP